MGACATLSNVVAAATTHGLEFSKFFLSRPSSVLAISAAGLLLVDSAAAPPRKAVRAVPRAFVRRTRRIRRRSLTGDDGGEDGCSRDGDGDDGAFGGGGGGGGGGRWWNFGGRGEPDWGNSDSTPTSSDPAFDLVYGVISFIALYSCTHFAFKRVGRFLADKERMVPLRLVPQFAE